LSDRWIDHDRRASLAADTEARPPLREERAGATEDVEHSCVKAFAVPLALSGVVRRVQEEIKSTRIRGRPRRKELLLGKYLGGDIRKARSLKAEIE
jgi:hypothetical protein